MALIRCPECSNEVSDSAELCPNCGYPIKKKAFKRKLNKKKRNLIISITSIVFVLLIVIVVISANPYNINELEKKASECIGGYMYFLHYPDSLMVYEMQFFSKNDGTEYFMMYYSCRDNEGGHTTTQYAVFTDWGLPEYYDPSDPDASNKLASLIVYTYWDNSNNAVLDVEKVMRAVDFR